MYIYFNPICVLIDLKNIWFGTKSSVSVELFTEI